MADSRIKLEGVHPTLDGEYPLDLGAFTNRDFHDIKRIANVRSQELSDAFDKGDTDMFVAFAVIALRNAGKAVSEDALWDAPVSSLTLIAGDVEEESLPPTSAPPIEIASEPVGGPRLSVASETSGSGSRSDSAVPDNAQNGTGGQSLVTGATSPSEMLAT